MIRILIADDHTLLRQGLKEMLELDPELSVVGEAADGLEAIKECAELNPDIVLMDINLPGISGITATKMLKEQRPQVQVIMLTVYEDEEYIAGAIRAGASGYVHKSISREDLVKAIRVVHQGDSFIQPRVTGKVLRRFAERAPDGEPQSPPLTSALTLRELEVLRLVAEGEPNKRIAAQLGISSDTVKTHIQSIFRKLDVADRAQAVAQAMRIGLLR